MTTSRHAGPEIRIESPQHPPEPLVAATWAFALLGRRWNVLILAALAKGPAGFAQLRERVPGISDRVLADRLQELTAVDLVARTGDPGPSASTRYTLSPHGNAFLIPLAAVIVWAEDHLPAGTTPPLGWASKRPDQG
ncbi:winged helix-turn-helix transcriptional regulator [Streptomyces sp. NPDC002143]